MGRWLQEKMRGRYGADELNRFMIGAALVMTVVNLFFRNGIVSTLSFLMLVLCYMRIFSRNYAKRREENFRFMKLWNPVQYKWKQAKMKWKDRRINKYYKCPKCSKMIRVPKGKGKICITCPMCKEEFIKRT